MGYELWRMGKFCAQLMSSLLLAILFVSALATFESGIWLAGGAERLLGWLNLRG